MHRAVIALVLAWPLAFGCAQTHRPVGTGAAGAGADGDSTGGVTAGLGDKSSGNVTFDLAVGATKSYCATSTNCSTPDLFAVLDADGNPVRRAVVDCAAVDCDTCAPPGCLGIDCPSRGESVSAQRLSWDGAVNVQSTCGAKMTSCSGRAYVRPGEFVARMCATPGTLTAGAVPECVPSGPPECVDVPFEYPSSAVVRGSL